VFDVNRQKIFRVRGPVGLISDTHGLVRPQALAALKNSALIIHAGDIGSPEVLEALEKIAPVIAIRGNNDRGAWTKALPDMVTLQVNALTFHVVHDLKDLDIDPAVDAVRIVVSGHSHKPGSVTKEGVLYLNPGSAGPRRFTLPVAVARLNFRGQKLQAKIIELKV
jgi:hypothetical protein